MIRLQPLHARCRICLLLGLFFLAGCSSQGEVPTYAVAGSVSLDGKPVSKARLAFMPDQANGNRGPQSFSFAQDGAFSFAKKRGLTEGPYLVDITVMNENGKPMGMTRQPVSIAPDDDNYLYLEMNSGDLQEVASEEDADTGEG